MQYLLMIHADESLWGNMTEEAQQAMLARYNVLIDDLKQKGQFVGAERLADTDTATTVRVREGETLLSDGPFVETKEALGGYFLVDCADLDEAVQIAARIPSAEMGTIEVRPLMYQPE